MFTGTMMRLTVQVFVLFAEELEENMRIRLFLDEK